MSYPHDAMLLQYELWPSVSLSWYCIETAEWIELAFSTDYGGYPQFILHRVIREFGYLQK